MFDHIELLLKPHLRSQNIIERITPKAIIHVGFLIKLSLF